MKLDEMFGKPSPEEYQRMMIKLRVAMIDAGRVGADMKPLEDVYDDIQEMLDGLRRDSAKRKERMK